MSLHSAKRLLSALVTRKGYKGYKGYSQTQPSLRFAFKQHLNVSKSHMLIRHLQPPGSIKNLRAMAKRLSASHSYLQTYYLQPYCCCDNFLSQRCTLPEGCTFLARVPRVRRFPLS